jgi:ribokinase
VVVGTVGFDDIETPESRVVEVLGGSATYATLASRLFACSSLSSVVGTDFPEAHRELLHQRDIDLSGLDVVAGNTFRWGGRYESNMNIRETTFVDLNVLSDFNPTLTDDARTNSFVFLGNTDPAIQLHVLDQVRNPRFVLADSMDLWIQRSKTQLEDVIARCSCVVLNDEEVRLFGDDPHLPRASRKILGLGPDAIIIKRGEYGAALLNNAGWFFVPGYPLENVVDPTGAGDSFAGAFLGSVAEAGTITNTVLRRAVVFGSIVASFTVEAFGVDRLMSLTRDEIDARYAEFRQFVAY